MNSYTEYGGGQSPDYFNDTLIQAVVDFVGRFGARYDNDTRIGFVQMGMLGFWGGGTRTHTSWFPPKQRRTASLMPTCKRFPYAPHAALPFRRGYVRAPAARALRRLLCLFDGVGQAKS